MLNGQLPLTDMFSCAHVARMPRKLFWAGIISCAVLAGCSSTGQRAPVVDLTSTPVPTPGTGGSYVVKPGDTLYKISRANGVEVENLKRWNNLTDSNRLTVGQVLKLSAPAGGATAGVPQSAPVAGSTKPQPRPLDQKDEQLPPPSTDTAPAVPPATTPGPAPANTPTPPPETPRPTRASDAGIINWAWPSTGQITQTFNANTKGIDIGGNPGDPVTAAADGKVMYSGNGVRGLGSLIIINHNNGFITAYAHNRALLVKTGQDVKRGAKIAELGQTDATTPRLHFEIRRQGTPVDPLQYLPAK